MNQEVRDFIQYEPEDGTLSDQEKRYYEIGFYVLGDIVGDEFLDIPYWEGENKYEDGYYYYLPYVENSSLGVEGNVKELMVVCEVQHMMLHGEFVIELEVYDGEKDFGIYVRNLISDRKDRKTLIEQIRGDVNTDFEFVDRLKLSDLIEG